jgi:hypothetical protein
MVRSDDALALDVTNALTSTRSSLVASPVAEVSGSSTVDPITPLQLLQAMGRATSSLPSLSKAGAAGLPGVAALSMASQWAILRYLWAFDPPTWELRFSSIVKTVRAHQRSVFSEQIGIAVATVVVERLIHTAAVSPLSIVDADALIDDEYLAALVGPLGRHRPDYFFYSGGTTPALFVIEVKGTRGSRASMVAQLARGLQQVSSVSRITGYRVRRIVIGTIATDAGMTAYAVELRDFDRDDQIRTAWRELASVRARDPKPVSDDTPEFNAAAAEQVPTTLDKAPVDEVLDLGEDARLLTVAGVPATRQALRATRTTFTNSISTLTERWEDDVAYSGTVTSARLAPGIGVEVFTGVQKDLLIVAAVQQAGTARKDDTRRLLLRPQAAPELSVVQDGNQLIRATSRSSDGCLVEVRLA